MHTDHQASRVYDTLRADGIAVVPTNAGYGLLAMGPRGVERIYALKGRPASKPCITVATWPVFDDVVEAVDADVRAWIAETIRWTPLAVVARLNPRSRMLRTQDPSVLAQSTQAGTIATFHAAGDLVVRVAELAHADGRLVVGSSGNRSGRGNAYTLDEVPMREEADLVVDCGPIPIPGSERLATTILDLETGTFIRQGLHFARIERSWRRAAPNASAAPSSARPSPSP